MNRFARCDRNNTVTTESKTDIIYVYGSQKEKIKQKEISRKKR